MPLQALMGGALAYANAAYTYNRGRFQFDANQAQSYDHQLMKFRVAQWNLFREDLRDLFELTSHHMSTYMVVGTMFLGFSVSAVASGVKDFPHDPPWLLLLWGNCLVSSLVYGTLCVWLAMHGSVAASSSNVKLRAQLVRPHIPTAEELKVAWRRLHQYEAGGAETLLRPPDLLGVGSMAKDALQSASSRSTAADRGTATAGEDDAASASSAGVPSSAGRIPRSRAPPDPRAHNVFDSMGSPSGSGPGRAACLDSHVELFKREQASFLSFDAYARVCLSGCASELLLTLAYFLVAYAYKRLVQDKKAVWQDAGAICWGGSIMLVFMAVSLFKIDLFVGRARMRLVKALLALGPCLACVALRLYFDGQRLALARILVTLAIVVHFSWSVLFLTEARPVGVLQLPMAFRNVRALDVLGSTTEDGPQVTGLQPGQDPVEMPQVLEAEGMGEALEELLRPGGYAEQLTEAERRRLQELRQECQSAGRPAGQASPASARQWWLLCHHVADSGQPMEYFVNPWTGEVCWEAPQGAKFISLQGAPEREAPERERSESGFEAFEIEEPSSGTSPGPSRDVALRRPGSKHDQASMPWKYFMQVACATIALWGLALGRCMASPSWLGIEPWTPSVAEPVALAWPHELFSPTALACGGGGLFLGDRLEVYAAELPVSAAVPPSVPLEPWALKLEPVLPAEGPPEPWVALAPVCGTGGLGPGGCSSLLLLGRDGRTVWEQPLPARPAGRGAAPAAAPRRWLVGPSLEAGLRAIASVDGRAATVHCGRRGNASRAEGGLWALIGATDHGEIVVLCPRGEHLQPARRVARGPAVPGVQELLAVHADARGRIWHMARSVAEAGCRRDAATLRSSAAAGEVPPEAHTLPPGRRWARGLCMLGRGGFLLAADAERPEMWHVPRVEDAAPDQRADEEATPSQAAI